MEIKTVWALHFSPTGNAERIALEAGRTLSESLGAALESVSLNAPAARRKEYVFGPADLLVIACPVYAGRLPNKIAPDLKACLRGNRTPSCALVTFGNRAYDNALAELASVLTAGGFDTVSAGALVGEHAFTDKLGGGRPGVTDIWELREFARKTAEAVRNFPANADNFSANADAVRNLSASGGFPSVSVPGDAEAGYYVPKGADGLPAKFLKAKPKINARCNQCGACAQICPMGAIDPRDASDVPGTCIKCQACVRRCTRQARFFDDAAFLSHVAMLEQTFTEPKENAFFYANFSRTQENRAL